METNNAPTPKQIQFITDLLEITGVFKEGIVADVATIKTKKAASEHIQRLLRGAEYRKVIANSFEDCYTFED